jgi:hypothetical protein
MRNNIFRHFLSLNFIISPVMKFMPCLAPTGKLRLLYIDVIHPALEILTRC